MRTRALLVVASALATACSLLVGEGLTGGRGVEQDASSDTTTPPSDATTPPDTEALDADASPAFCSLHDAAVFCTDFDDGRSLDQVWTNFNLVDAASAGISTLQFESPPNSGIFQSTTSASGSSPPANIGRTFTWPTPQTDFTVSMSMFFAGYPASNTMYVFAASFRVSGPTNAALSTVLRIRRSANGSLEVSHQSVADPKDGGAPVYRNASVDFPFPAGQWIHVVRHLKLSDPPSETLTVDGQPATTLDLDPAAFVPVTKAELQIGFALTDGSEPVTQFVDNVLLEAK